MCEDAANLVTSVAIQTAPCCIGSCLDLEDIKKLAVKHDNFQLIKAEMSAEIFSILA